MRYRVQYTQPCLRRIVVGIEAEDPTAALAEAGQLFGAGALPQDGLEVPLLHDDCEPLAGVPELTVLGSCPAGWPESDDSAGARSRCKAAVEAARLLVEAYRSGEKRGGSVDWDDLDRAYEAALWVAGMEV